MLFDLDGVVTPTAVVHMRAWSDMFNAYLAEYDGPGDSSPYTDADYYAHVDGKPRYDGVRDFLTSRGIPAAEDLVRELGDRKNDAFNAVLEAAGLADRFAAVVSGAVTTELHLRGKPAPDTFLHAAEVLGATAATSVVLEDAVSGVRAGAAGDFGAVVGVDRGAGSEALIAAGATVVVSDLAELVPGGAA